VTFASSRAEPVGLHLAILAKPFLSLVLNGRKTIESRFTRTRCAPFDQIRRGDIILLKQVGGPVCGLVLAKQTWFFDLYHQPIETIREMYAAPICADDAFWERKRDAAYATLIELAEPVSIDAMPCNKRDRRGWVVLTPSQMSLAF
jgi:ASC-1-like (ASCH) protein